MKEYEWFEHEMTVNGVDTLLVKSHAEALGSERVHNLVFIPDEETGLFDIYLTAKKDGLFGEYVCWVASEFVDEPELLYDVIALILGAYQGEPSEIEGKLMQMNPQLRFNPYDPNEYQEMYRHFLTPTT